ncbi:MAG: long-chain fatty acid--CoA ligase [Gammaproteobacteria bacterium]|nr:long-chain fatty acid--CoA ligase [Gammaproteobacteria bacterium]
MRTIPIDITLGEVETLPDLFRKRIERTPEHVAYRYFDKRTQQWLDSSWREMAELAGRWQQALLAEGLEPGERVGIMMPNCREWVLFDQATLGLGLVNVPLFYNDRGGNVAYIVGDADLRLLFIQGDEQWQSLQPVLEQIQATTRVISCQPVRPKPGQAAPQTLAEWLPQQGGSYRLREDIGPDSLATVVYTSGTTGHPKGVMLSHRNVLCNAYDSLMTTDVGSGDVMLSFLPLSHMLERMAGYYLAMMGDITVAYARSVPELPEDLLVIRPTVLISVPRIYERIYARIQEGLQQKPAAVRKLFRLAVDVGWKRFEYLQGRAGWSPALLLWPLLERLVAAKVVARLGGRLHTAISGGAPLPADIARTFLALGVPVIQGYGLTETSPVLTVNRVKANLPESVGTRLDHVALKVGNEGELLAQGESVMLGFWNRPEETARVIDPEGWLHTGDVARIDEQGYVYITGRLKDIIVLANGEKVSPADMELAIALDPLIEQVMVVGEGRAFLSALIVPAREPWQRLSADLGLDPDAAASYRDERVLQQVMARIGAQLREFPGYAQIRAITLLQEPWSVENGLLTPTLKTRRSEVLKHYDDDLQRLYQGH